uniref:J domain-containing protein n=1 Tax=Alexandrium monilatum TaxID=311494 RepID=A0A7S4V5K5_9DINO|mmetsp:Transcript_56820/g.176748  ORF Transcript_56820/g.176748 Transcript_56820/m.176748 type:complete len:496 (+) Transcript_56820:75-1562(+)
MGGELDVVVHIDRDLGISVTKALVAGATVLDLKVQLAGDDPTGRARVEDFVLVGPDGVPLGNAEPLTPALQEVTLQERPADEQPPGPSPPPSSEAQQPEADAPPPEAQPPEAQVSTQGVWEVVGGADRGGILVRAGPLTSSPQLADRLATGAFVAEAALEGERLRYRLLAGAGPGTGWVCVKLKDKVLLRRRPDRQPADFPEGSAQPAPSEPPSAGSRGAGGGRAGGGQSSWNPGEFNPYELLGVPHDATEAAINSAFRKASLRVHPDHCPDDPDAHAKFQQLTEAKALLLDPGKRHLYDMKHGVGRDKTAGNDIVSYGTEGPKSDLVPIMLFRELCFTERLAIPISDARTGSQVLLPLQLFAAKDGAVRVGCRVVELALMMGANPMALAQIATMDAVCEGDEMPQLRANGEEDEELPARSGNLGRAIIQMMDFPKALGLASPSWLRKNNTVMLSQKISQRLVEVTFEADLAGDPVTMNALNTAQQHTSGWWSSG